MTLDQIVRATKDGGSHFFDPETMRFFCSRISDKIHHGPGGIFFVTSERFNSVSPRYYTVRQFNPATASINTVARFQGYKTSESAHRAAEKFANPSD